MGLIDDYDTGVIEEDKCLSDKKDKVMEKTLDEVIKTYDYYLETPFYHKPETKQKIHELNITPELIDIFCFKLKDFKGKHNFHSCGDFLSIMLKESHLRGHNHFIIDTRHLNSRLSNIANDMVFSITKQNKLNIVVKGEAGYNCARGCNFLDITFQNKAGVNSGSNLAFSKVVFKDNASGYCFKMAYKSFCEFNKHPGNYSANDCRESTIIYRSLAGEGSALGCFNCDIYFYDLIEKKTGLRSRNSKFYSPNIHTLKQINDVCGSGCKFYLLDDKGNAKPYGFKTQLWNLFGGKK